MVIKKYWWVGIAFLGFASVMGAYALEKFGQWPACRLCHIERWILGLMGLLALTRLAFCGHQPSRNGFSLMMVLISGIGSCVSVYHTAIQFQWIALPHFCQLSDADTYAQFMALPTATCDQWTLTFLGLPAPLYLIFLFSMISFLTGFFNSQKPKGTSKKR
jgi:disulfide bond formation protein DsbB